MKTVSNDIEVFVADGERNILAGRMYPHFRRGSESASFIYDDQYLANPRAYQLDPGCLWSPARCRRRSAVHCSAPSPTVCRTAGAGH